MDLPLTDKTAFSGMPKQPDHALSVTERLTAMIAAGKLRADPQQTMIAGKLDAISGELKAQRLASKSSSLGWLFAAKRSQSTPVQGLYIHGSVGRGKTMLMDMFFELAPPERKRRAHFHAFMADVHERIHAHRQKLKSGETNQADPVAPVAAQLFAGATLFCFDEFTVSDITDAMILARLFTELFALGATLVATSNVAPDTLYQDGLNRALFLPFITLLKDHVTVAELKSPTDYRLEKLNNLPVWISPLDPPAIKLFEDAWREATAGRIVRPEIIPLKGRDIAVPQAAGNVARFTFADLCEAPLAAMDYLAIAARHDTLFIGHIPVLTPDRRNEAKRFINLVDTLYDRRVRLFALAATEPAGILTVRHGVEGFEFDRTVSRLMEMQSADYRAEHLKSHLKV